jgi:hypothetical protein
MGFTAIHKVKNLRAHMVRVSNIETPGDTARGKGDVSPVSPQEPEGKGLYMYIPWATTAEDFQRHRIGIELLDGEGNVAGVRAIWQQGSKGGPDLVRCSDGAFTGPPNAIGGVAAVDGERRLIIGPDDALSLEVYTGPRPGPPARPVMQTRIPLRQVTGNPFKFTGRANLFRPEAVVDRVVNTAKNTAGQGMRIHLYLAAVDGSPLAGPADLQPDAVLYGDFAGRPAAGEWTAVPQDISRALVPDPFWIDLFYRIPEE